MKKHKKSGELIAFLPCRSGSQRVPFKNTRQFDNNGRSLFDIKISQLISCQYIDRIVVSTNDEMIINAVESVCKWNGERIVLDRRPDHLCSSATLTDELIRYVPTIIPSGHILWTHVTSPFVEPSDYSDIINRYFENLSSGEFTSLMTVTRLQGFMWNEAGPINYDRTKEKWPRTQMLDIVYEVNSAAFLISAALMAQTGDRISDRVLMYELSKSKSVDIDHIDEFNLASDMYSRHKARVAGSESEF